jgi:beta-lactamase class A
MTNPYAAEIEFVFEKGFLVPTTLTLEGKPPHRVAGLLFRNPAKETDNVDAIVAELKSVPGSVAFCLMRLDPSPRTVWALNPDQPLAVGSSFKLIVLAALAEEIARGRRTWHEVVPVRKDWASLPAGLVQDWPDGAPITLHTLATLMTSRSDNTAADHLIRLLGRERVEAVQQLLGVKAPDRNRPLLCTADMFKIKLVLPPERQREYVAADSGQRRRLLESQVRDASLAQKRIISDPQLIEEVEWFFSAADLCRVMDWFRRLPRTGPQGDELGPTARAILAVNQGLSLDQAYWSYIGYKGGAEPGVRNYTLLLQNKEQAWFAFSLTCNDPKSEVDQTKLITLAQRLLRLAQRQPKD